MIEPEGHFGTGIGGKHVPRFGLAMRQAHRARERVVRMHLNGKCLVGEEQLEQKRRFRRRRIHALEPEFTDRCPIADRACSKGADRISPKACEQPIPM